MPGHRRSFFRVVVSEKITSFTPSSQMTERRGSKCQHAVEGTDTQVEKRSKANRVNDIPLAIEEKFLRPYSALPVAKAPGGLSSSRVYRCRSNQGDLCLRCWPESVSIQHLQFIRQHVVLARDQGIGILCDYLTSRDERFFEESEGRYWELTTWLPGKADYLENRKMQKLRSVMRALAKLHLVWRESGGAFSQITRTSQPSPAVKQRIELLNSALARFSVSFPSTLHSDLKSGAQPKWAGCVQRTLERLRTLGPNVLAELKSICDKAVTVHFVLRDVWSEHVLFTGEDVTGIVDYGAARIDEPATDLARLLGSLEPFDTAAWTRGLEAYHDVNTSIDFHRVAVLDRATCLLSAAQWLQWLGVEDRQFPAEDSWLEQRWSGLLDRLEQCF